jgi:hypothetical protein
VSTRENWLEVTLEGWIWTQSIQTAEHSVYDLRVSAPEGENLRSEPQGEVLAILNRATLLLRISETSGWMRVERTGFVWTASVEVQGMAAEAAPRTETRPPPQEVRPQEISPQRAPSSVAERRLRVGGEGLAVLSDPDGDTLGILHPRLEAPILAREGSWVRVRIEGWAWSPEGMEGAADSVASEELTPLQVMTQAETSRGRVVSWVLQFISLEEAEQIRTDFYEGEPFLLTRSVNGDPVFVYVAVPPERMEEVQGLTPLERIRVVGRIRTGTAALTGNPIVDLLEIERINRQ